MDEKTGGTKTKIRLLGIGDRRGRMVLTVYRSILAGMNPNDIRSALQDLLRIYDSASGSPDHVRVRRDDVDAIVSHPALARLTPDERNLSAKARALGIDETIILDHLRAFRVDEINLP